MTNEEIEKALEHCLNISNCYADSGCPYADPRNTFIACHALVQDALDYINRLKSENEDMYGEIMSLRAYIDNHEEIWKSNAKIENERFIKNMQNVLEIEKEQIRKDTKEILQEYSQQLIDEFKESGESQCNTTVAKVLKLICPEKVNKIMKKCAKKCGVEVGDGR